MTDRPLCCDCSGPIESDDQLGVSLVRFRLPRCRACFDKAKVAVGNRPLPPEPRKKPAKARRTRPTQLPLFAPPPPLEVLESLLVTLEHVSVGMDHFEVPLLRVNTLTQLMADAVQAMDDAITAIRLLDNQAPLAAKYPDGTRRRYPLTPRQVIYLAALAPPAEDVKGADVIQLGR